jgi:hypothetical protein
MSIYPDNNSKDSSEISNKNIHLPPKSFSAKIFNIIMEYRESKLFKWVSGHPEIAMILVAVWGMSIIIVFLWFLFTRVVR